MDCLFCKFSHHEVPKDFVYEDNDVMVFADIHPIKPVHLLIVPKQHIPTFSTLKDDGLIAKIQKVIQQQVQEWKLEGKGYRIVVNGGGAQVIDHLHFHLTGPWGSNTDR